MQATDPPAPETFFAECALLHDAARASGEIAKRHFGRAPEVWDKPGQGPVTAADLEVDRMLRAELGQARPDYGWLSEESPDTPERLTRARVFIVDPIDGTRAFIKGERNWSHSLALAEDGKIVAAVVHLPLLERTYIAGLGLGATANGAPIVPSTQADPDGAAVLATAPQFDPQHWPGGVPRASRHFRTSLAYRLCLVAEGRFDAMVTFRDAFEWDVAAGDLIVQEAGGRVTTREGLRARYNNPAPKVAGMIAAGPALHAALLART